MNEIGEEMMEATLIGKCADCGRRAILSEDFKCRSCESKASVQMLGMTLALLLLVTGGILLWIARNA